MFYLIGQRKYISDSADRRMSQAKEIPKKNESIVYNKSPEDDVTVTINDDTVQHTMEIREVKDLLPNYVCNLISCTYVYVTLNLHIEELNDQGLLHASASLNVLTNL